MASERDHKELLPSIAPLRCGQAVCGQKSFQFQRLERAAEPRTSFSLLCRSIDTDGRGWRDQSRGSRIARLGMGIDLGGKFLLCHTPRFCKEMWVFLASLGALGSLDDLEN